MDTSDVRRETGAAKAGSSALRAACERILDAQVDAWHRILGQDLVSVVLYGSWARGTATADSDIDLLIVAERLPAGRWDRQELAVRARRLTAPLVDEVFEAIHWYAYPSILLKTRREADGFQRLYLDMVGEARVMVDADAFFGNVLGRVRDRMKELGSKKVMVGNQWYWILKPDIRPGEEFEL